MSEMGVRTISFTITVTQCKNLCSNKGESFPVNSVARINFLGETIDSEVVKDNKNPTFNFSVSIERPMTPQLLSSALNSTLTITIVEHSRSQGPNIGATGQVIGWVAIDLLPLVCGDSKIPFQFRPLIKSNGEMIEGAEVEVGMTSSSPLLTHDEFAKGSILSVYFDSVYSIPSKWVGRGVDAETNPFNYILSFVPPAFSSTLPTNENKEKENEESISESVSEVSKPVDIEGSLSFPGDDDEANPISSILYARARSLTRSASPNIASIASSNNLSSPPHSPSPSSSLSLHHPLFPTFYDESHFRNSENLNLVPRVKFDNGFKIFLHAEDLEKWKEMLENAFTLNASLAEYKTIPLGKLDLTRSLKPQYTEYEDPNKEKYHGEIVVNLHELLEPGVTSLHGRFKITQLNDNSEADGNVVVEASDSDREEDADDDDREPTKEEKGLRESRGESPKKRNKSSPAKKKSSKKSGDEGNSSSSTNTGIVVPPIELQRTPSNSKDSKDSKDSNALAASGEKKKKKKAKGTAEAGGRRGKARRGKLRDISKLLKVDPIPNPYLVARSYIHLEVVLSKPLVPKIPTPRKLLKPSDYIPKRPPLPRFFQLKEATEEFNQQISAIVADLASEYKRIFQQTNQGGDAMKEERRRRMTFELNDSGDYFVIKEKLKKSIVRIVKEKFQFQVSNTRNPKELEAFLNELYVYLVDQMHTTLQQSLTSSTVFVKPTKASLSSSASPSSSFSSVISPPSLLPPNNSKICADEAELLCKYSQAAAYYQTQVVRVGGAHAWGQYGLYALRMGDKSKAEECLREAIALDDSIPDCLSAYGVLMFVKGNLEKAEVFLRAALALQPTNSVLACLLVKLYITTQRDEEMKEMSAISSKVPDTHLQTVKYLLELNVPTLAEQLLSESNEGVTTPSTSRTNRSSNSQSNININNNNAPSLPTHTHLVYMGLVLLTQKDFASASYFINSLQSRAPRDPAVWALAGHIHYMKRNIDEGIACFETALSCIDEPSAPDSVPSSTLTLGAPTFSIFSERAILLRLGDLYMDKRNCNSAKTVFLKACSLYSSPAAWFGTGVALYHSGLYQEAESALAEANIHDPNSPVIWGYLTLLCLKILRHREASQAFKLALKLRLSDPVLLCDIGESYLANSNYGIAEECARAAIAHYQEQMEARKKSQPQDRWQVKDPVEEQYERAVLLLEKLHKN